MGSPKISSTTQNTTSTATATPEEQAMQATQLKQFQGYEPFQTQMLQNMFSTGNNLLNSVNQPNSDAWKTLLGGVTEQQTRNSMNISDRALRGSFQQQGIYDSGTAASARMRSGADIANTNAQFNVGALQNALNLALGGSAQVQQAGQGNANSLASSLQGLRTITGQTSGIQRSPFTGTNLGILGTWGGNY